MFHNSSLFFFVFLCFLVFFAAVDGLGWCGDGPDVVGNGSDGMGSDRIGLLLHFSGFAIDRSKKYMKTIKIDVKIDAVDPWAAADSPPHPPVTTDRSMGPYNPKIPVK